MITVCMATFNGEKYLREQIDSILAQIGQNDELVVSDDGSTDKTLDILGNYQDSRIKIYHHGKTQQKFSFGYTTANFGNALSYAKGDYIFLADQDDVWLAGRVEKMIEKLQSVDVVISDCEIVDENLRILIPSKFKAEGIYTGAIRNIIKCTYLGCTMAFRHSVLDYVLPFPKNVPHDLWIGMLIKFGGKIEVLDEPTIMYRRHMNNVSATSGVVVETGASLPKNTNTLRFRLSYRLILLKEYLKFVCKKILSSVK